MAGKNKQMVPGREGDPEAPQRATTAAMVIIGNEILSGKVIDTNSPFLCRELTFLGIEVARLTTIPDDLALIGQTVRDYAEAFNWVFTSGGIGPTHDDMTIPAIAEAFGVPTVMDPQLEGEIRRHYADRLTEDHLLMARVPQGATLEDVEGLYYPQVRFKNIYILPGVPQLFQYKFNAIKANFRAAPIFLREIFLRADEGVIAAALRETDEAFPQVLIGSYPSFFRKDYSLKITVEGRNEEMVTQAMQAVRTKISNLPVTIVREG